MFTKQDIQTIIKKYETGTNARILAKEFNTCSSSIHKLLRQNGATKKLIKHQNNLKQNKEEIINLYQQNVPLHIIAKKYNTPPISVATFLKKYTTYKVAKRNFNNIPVSEKQKIYKLHHHKKLTLKQIGKIYNCSAPKVATYFDKNNILRRTKKEAVILTNQDAKTAYRRLNNLHKIKKYILPSGKTVNLKGYEPQFLDFVFRNNLLLETDIIYKPKRIQYIQDNQIRYYYPDFYIPKHNLIVEIKSAYIAKLQTIKNLKNKEQGVIDAGHNYCLIIDNNFLNFVNKVK